MRTECINMYYQNWPMSSADAVSKYQSAGPEAELAAPHLNNNTHFMLNCSYMQFAIIKVTVIYSAQFFNNMPHLVYAR